MTASRSFTVRGSRNGSLVHVTWRDGELSGDFPTVDMILIEAELLAASADDPLFGRDYADLGVAVGGDPLSDPSSAYRLIRHVVDVIGEVTGEPPPEALEDG